MDSKYESHFQYSLHSVRKEPFKPWKKPIAPLPPMRPKVYKVEQENFKQVVQELTAEPEYRSRRLQNFAPPPLDLLSSTTTSTTTVLEKETTLDLLRSSDVILTPTWSSIYRELMTESAEMQPCKQIDSLNTFSPLGLGMSTTSYGWCSLPLLSPGTIASLEQATIL